MLRRGRKRYPVLDGEGKEGGGEDVEERREGEVGMLMSW